MEGGPLLDRRACTQAQSIHAFDQAQEQHEHVLASGPLHRQRQGLQRDGREPFTQERLRVDWRIGDQGAVLVADARRERNQGPRVTRGRPKPRLAFSLGAELKARGDVRDREQTNGIRVPEPHDQAERLLGTRARDDFVIRAAARAQGRGAQDLAARKREPRGQLPRTTMVRNRSARARTATKSFTIIS